MLHNDESNAKEMRGIVEKQKREEHNLFARCFWGWAMKAN
jgi:hypothetical protein